MQLQPNTLFHDHYTLVRLIGRGGFSEVWLAQDKYTGLDLALKIYAPNGGLDSDGIEAFAGEIRRVYNLNHPNLLKPQHFDVCGGMPYLVMPYCANGSVTKRAGHISEDEIWNVLHDVAAGLAYLHEHNIVHQDIKPDNILQAADGHYLITDFGISARTRATLSKTQSINNIGSGTAAYMAPERFSTNPAPTFSSDVWALGATLYELITGSVPFGDGTLPGGLLQKNGAEVPSIIGDYSEQLKHIINIMLATNPWDRPTAVILENEKRVSHTCITEPNAELPKPNNPVEGTQKKVEIDLSNIREIMLAILIVFFGAIVILLIGGLVSILT